MKIEYVDGDIFESSERVYAHGCNCQNMMGAGFAKEIARRFPEVKRKYSIACKAGVFNLGYAQYVLDASNDRAVYNLATQKQGGANATKFGIFLSFCNMFEHAKANGIERIGIPRIGTGIGGLAWEEVEEMINLAAESVRNVAQIVVYTYTP